MSYSLTRSLVLSDQRTYSLPLHLKRKKGRPRKKRIEQFRQGLPAEFAAEDVGSQDASQQAGEAVESGEQSSESEDRIACWDRGIEEDKRIAAKGQAEENGNAVLGGNSTAGKSKRSPKHSWECVLEPIEQPAITVTVASRTRSGRL
jgi:hypothetical protein